MKRVICVNSMFLFLFLFIWPLKIYVQCSIARKWNEVLLEAIRNDYGRPTVYARNLFHTSIAIYDAWAFYDNKADTYSLGRKVGISAFNKANNYFNGETVTCIEQYTYYDILLYPNPVTGQEINLKLIEPFDGEMIFVSMLDMHGRVIETTDYIQQKDVISINLGKISQENYLNKTRTGISEFVLKTLILRK